MVLAEAWRSVMAKGKILLAFPSAMIEVNGEAVGPFGLHRGTVFTGLHAGPVSQEGRHWSIVQLASGWRICRVNTKRQARATIKRLLEWPVDWYDAATFSHPERCAEYRPYMETILREVGAPCA